MTKGCLLQFALPSHRGDIVVKHGTRRLCLIQGALFIAAGMACSALAAAQQVLPPAYWFFTGNYNYNPGPQDSQQAAISAWITQANSSFHPPFWVSGGSCGALGTASYRNCVVVGSDGTTAPLDAFLACPITPTVGIISFDGITCPTYFVTADPPPLGERCCADSVGDPINPATGNASYDETDIPVEGVEGTSPFIRYYNSADGTTHDIGAGWRHSFSRQVLADNQPTMQTYLVGSTRYSHIQSTPSDACITGFAQIRATVPAWATLGAQFANNTCTLYQGATPVATLPVQNVHKYLGPTVAATNYKAIRDNGQVVLFSVQGGVLTPPAGITLRLTQTAGGFELRDDDDNVELYDINGRLISVTSRSGIVQSAAYDTAGRLASVVDSFGRSVTLSYDGQNRLSLLVAPDSSAIQYAYDSKSRLSTITAADGTSRTYLYENASLANLLTGVVDQNGSRYSTWSYDAAGRATSTQEASGAAAVSLTYNADATTVVVDALGATRTFNFQRVGHRNASTAISGSQCPTCADGASTSYNALGFVSSRRDYNANLYCFEQGSPRGLELVRVEGFAPSAAACPSNLASYTPAAGTRERKISTTWHATYRVPLSVTETGRTTTYTYDTSGNMLSRTVTDTAATPSVSRTWTYTYDSFGRVLTADGPRTDVVDKTTYTYYTCTTGAQCGQVNTITNAAGQVTTYNTYNAHGQPLTITDPNGVLTTLTYDLRQRLKTRQVGTETTAFDYYPTGLLQKVTLPDASFLQYTYDAAHRLTKMTDGLGNHVDYVLDAMGNRTAETALDNSSVLSRTRSRVYNTLNQLSQDIGAAGNVAVTTTFGYDSNGNQTSINAPLTRNTINQFDELNRFKQITDPNSGNTLFGYDANDNLTSVTDPSALATSYTYTGFGDLKTQVSPQTGSTINTYDTGGNLATSLDARGNTATYSYDALNRVTQVAYGDQTIVYTYDAGTNGKGRLTGASDANHAMSWAYDPLGRVTSKSQTASSVTRTVGYAYTIGQLTTLTTPSGQNVGYTYANGRITSITVNGTALVSSVLYEPFGPARGWTWGNATLESRLHDTDGNVSLISGIEATSFGYDAAFRATNATNASTPAASWTYSYDPLDRLATAYSPSSALTWTYDAVGNRQSQIGGMLPSYLGTNIMLTYNKRNRLVSFAGTNTATYAYNALGQRIQKSAGGSTTVFVYDEAGHLLGEYTGAAGLIQETIWLGDVPVATLRPKVGGGVDLYYVHADPLNAPKMITRATDNAVMWRWDQDPFGTALPNQNPQALGPYVYNLRMPGQYFDSETGLNYNYFRDYDSVTGRYVESDPLGQFAGVNTYAYVGNDPVFWSDPLGLDVQVCRAPAQIAGGLVDHMWIKTSTKEAGMGGPAAVPGDQYESLYITKVYITDQTGQSKSRKGASCKVVDADEKTVNNLLQIGKPLGHFSPLNNCQTFANSVLIQATTSDQRADAAIREISKIPGLR